MAGRYSRDSLVVDERDYHTGSGRPRPRSEAGFYERREEIRSPSRVRETDRVDVRVRERERSREREPLDRYFRDDRRSEPGAMVLRQRDVETVEHRPRPRPRSPTPVRVREFVRQRSLSRSPSPQREVSRVEIRDRVVDRGRGRSPSPSPERRIRIEHSRSRAPSPSPSPPPQEARPVIRGPVVEREVITHYTDVDHGVVYARPQAPPTPEPTRKKHDMEVDVYTSHGRSSRTEVDVDISGSKSRERHRSRPPPQNYENELVVRTDRLAVDIDGRRRAHSAAPPRSTRFSDDELEADYIESRIDERGRVGEAFHGATKGWSIVDVPPGTERVRMDGAGGGSAEVTWQKYSGVRRTRFIPDRDEGAPSVVVSEHRHREAPREKDGDRINVQIIEKDRGRAHSPPRDDMWTEITKDLVNREAIERYGYPYTETDYFFYVLKYLRQEDVQDLVQLTDRIRRQRRRDRQAPRHSHEEIDIAVQRRPRSQSRPRRRYEDEHEHIREEVIIDHPRSYYR